MAGFTPDEGETLIGNLIYKNADADRGSSLELLLFTNVAPSETIAESALTEPTGTGYARISLADASWTVAGDLNSYAEQTFTAGAGGFSGTIQGYAIVTTGSTPRILNIEVDGGGSFTMNENDTYKVTPQVTIA